MIRAMLPFLTFIFFIVEGTVMQVFSPEWFGISDMVLIPRFVIVMILFISFFLKRSTALIYGLIFGFLWDVIYTDLIGVYFFSMTFTAYLIASISKIFHPHLIIALFLSLFGIIILEFQVYGLYTLVGIAELTTDDFLNQRLFPSLILNGVFVILIYYPLRKHFMILKEANHQEN
jgi:rod shape-determining protein MreD